jgi:glycosyltransferase involved in cell wall biosynthesis
MTEKPKTALLLIETLNRGGIENVLLRLIPKLKEEGWSSTIVTLRDGGEMLSEYERAGITVLPLKQTYFLSLTTLFKTYKQIQLVQPDVIVTTLFKADVIGRLFLRFVTRKPVIPYLVTTYNHPRYWIARFFEWLTKPLATYYIANSEAVQTFYENHLGVKSGKIVVAPNGVDIDMFQNANATLVEKELNLAPNAFVVTCVANLAPNKGQADLLAAFDQAFANNPLTFLLLVGDGKEREALTNQRELLLSKERIFILGRRTDVPALLKLTSVFVLPTLFEGMSTAILEAMAANKAIITTDIPENRVLLTHQKSALLIKPRDRKALAQTLTVLYEDSGLRERLSQEATRYVKKNYSITQMAQAFALIFNTLYHSRPQAKVVHVIGSLDIGGAENLLLKMLPLLNRGAFEQVVITLFRPGELAPKLEAKGVTTINIGMHNFFDIKSLHKLNAEVKKQNPGLIITYLFHASLIGRLYLQQRTAVPVIPFLRSTYNFPRYLPARLFERMTKGYVSHYFANSEAVKDYYVKNIGVQPDKITIIHNGIDTSVYDHVNGKRVKDELKLPNNSIIITCIANLAINKGHAYLLEAFETVFKRYPNAYLLVVGEGHERKNLEYQAKNYLSYSHILFLGHRTDIPEILAIATIFVLPTLFEGLSNALLEAMAARCAIITTNIPENKVIIEHNKTGLLIPTKNSAALSAALLDLINNKDQQNQLGTHAHSFIKKHFDLNTISHELEQALHVYAK